MFGPLGTPEIIIIGVVIILIFGVGKLSGLGRDLGSSIKEFRRAVKDEDPEEAAAEQQQEASTVQAPQQPSAPPQQQATPPQQPAAPPQQTQYTPPPTQPPAGSGDTKPKIF